MKKILITSAIVLLSSFAHADDICGKVKKISMDLHAWPKVEFSDGRSFSNVRLTEHDNPYVAASLTGDITVCFSRIEGHYIFSSASK